MRNLKGTYVHRGDVARRTRRVKQSLLVVGLVAAAWVFIGTRKTSTANAETTPNTSRGFFSLTGEGRKLRNDLANLQGQLDLVQGQYQRANQIIELSTRFDISAGLSGSIFDAAVSEGIDPELAFRLVRLESAFNTHALSSTGAIGLTQLMPSTARLFKPDVSRDDLYDKDTNLKIGFHYLRSLLRLYKGDVQLALTAYNRGEDAVDRALKLGLNPRNGYDRSVLGNYRGKGIIE